VKLDITDTKIRRAQAEGLLIEISGEDPGPKVDLLLNRMKMIFSEEKKMKMIRLIRKVDILFKC